MKKQKELEEQQKKQKELELKNKIIITCKSFPNPPLIGLENIGSTCYMNATLQCFCQTEVLTNYFLNENHHDKIYNNNIAKKNPNELQLSPSYLNLINNLWKNQNKKSFAPIEFRKKLAEMNHLFKDKFPDNPNHFILYIIGQMHQELNFHKENENNKFNNFLINDDYNEKLTLKNFINDFFLKNRSIFIDHFFGIEEIKYQCSGCQKRNLNSRYKFNSFFFLSVPLQEVKNLRNSQLNIDNFFLQNHSFNKNIINIYDCFDYLKRVQNFDMWCEECRGLFQFKYQNIIYSGPNILIIIINKKNNNQLKVKFDYYESLNLDNYIFKKDKPSIIYDLYGVVSYIEENNIYISSCKSPCDNIWYRYNDSKVIPIDDFKSEICDFGKPIILFYKKI